MGIEHRCPIGKRLLDLFLKNEGVLLSKTEIASKLWNGTIEVDGVKRLIKRLKTKLGPAEALISSRRQGGYIFKKEEDISTPLSG